MSLTSPSLKLEDIGKIGIYNENTHSFKGAQQATARLMETL